MCAVAALAIALGCSIEAVRLRRLRDRYLRAASDHAAWEIANLNLEQSASAQAENWDSRNASFDTLESALSTPGKPDRDNVRLPKRLSRMKTNPAIEALRSKNAVMLKDFAAECRDEAARYARSAAYHAAQKRKYLHAVGRPWWPVEPDPPPPEPDRQGEYWIERGRYRQALAAYEEAVRLEPSDSSSLNNLAWMLGTCPDAKLRDGKRAVGLASQACELSERSDVACIDTLAAAHAEAGDFQAAVETQREAIAMLPREDPRLEPFRARLKAYEGNKPFREAAKHAEQ
jgi:tetratricopeptide (TPR) repeat protein